MQKKELDIDVEETRDKLLAMSPLLILLNGNSVMLRNIFGEQNANKIIEVQKKFLDKLDNLMKHKYKTSIMGFFPDQSFGYKGLLQKETSRFSSFIFVLCNLQKLDAFYFLEKNLHILQNAQVALENEQDLHTKLNELNKIASNQQLSQAMDPSFLSKLSEVGTVLNELNGFIPLSCVKPFISLCDGLILFCKNLDAVRRLNTIYEALYQLVDQVPNAIDRFKILLGCAFYANNMQDEKKLLDAILDLHLKNFSEKDFHQTLSEMLNNFIDSQHCEIIFDQYENNQSLVIWESLKTFVNIYHQKEPLLIDKVNNMLLKIKEYEAAQLTDDSQKTPVLTVEYVEIKTDSTAKSKTMFFSAANVENGTLHLPITDNNNDYNYIKG